MDQIRTAATATAGDVKRQVRQVTNAIVETVKDEAQNLLDEQRDAAVAKVGGASKVARRVAHALRAVRLDDVANLADSAAERAEDLSAYVKESDVTQVLQDAEDLARRHRVLVTGGLFVVGFALARFLKAGEERDDGEGQGRSSRSSASSRPKGRQVVGGRRRTGGA